MLDVGSGAKPYRPFFTRAREYVGVDERDSGADLHAPAEQLPVPDGHFQIVLCTQVLEHADDPARAVRELRRVVAPGGLVLASTHGVQVYHPIRSTFDAGPTRASAACSRRTATGSP